MRFCNACKTTYPPSISVCPRDGQATVSISQQGDGDDPAIGKFAGSYRLLRRLGQGGMGAVYLAEHPTLKKRAAVKLLHAEYAQKSIVIERFFAEARAVSQIGHQHIVEILDFGVIDDLRLPFMLMEFLDGRSLQEVLRTKKQLSCEEAVAIVQQLLSALGAAHRKNVIHRDLKPDNILLITRDNNDKFVKLLDFGVAKLLDSRQSSGITLAGSLVGTPQYMPPEQAQGSAGEIDARTDLYAVGVILFELLCGRLPFVESNFGDLVIAHITKPPPSPRGLNPAISPALEAAILKALQKSPADRFASAEAMSDALRAATAPHEAARVRPVAVEPAPTASGEPFTDQSTTLSGGVGELLSPRKSSRLALVGGLGLALGVVLVFSFRGAFLSGAGNGAPTLAASLPPAPATAPAEIPTPTSAPASQTTPIAPESLPSAEEVVLSLTGPKGAFVSVSINGEKAFALKKRVPTAVSLPAEASVELVYSWGGQQWRTSLRKISASREFVSLPPETSSLPKEPKLPSEPTPLGNGTIDPYANP